MKYVEQSGVRIANSIEGKGKEENNLEYGK